MNCLHYLFLKGFEVPQPVVETFERLPRDPYIKGGYKFRCRAISRSHVENGMLQWSPTSPYSQSKQINTYLGDVVRDYPEVENDVKRYMEALVTEGPIGTLFHGRLGRFECHQIRITADETETGDPTPEGWHRDGYSYVAVLCVNRRNTSGGVSFIRTGETPNRILFEGILGAWRHDSYG